MNYSWDFDLCLDLELLLNARNFDRCRPRAPFAFYPQLWKRLQRRRAALRRLRAGASPPGDSRAPGWGFTTDGVRAVADVADDARLFLRGSRRTAVSSLVWRFMLDPRMSGPMVELALLRHLRAPTCLGSIPS